MRSLTVAADTPVAAAIVTADGARLAAFYASLGLHVSGPRPAAGAQRWRVRLGTSSIKIDQVDPAPASPPPGAAGYAELALPVVAGSGLVEGTEMTDPDGNRLRVGRGSAGVETLGATVAAAAPERLAGYYRALGFSSETGLDRALCLGPLALRFTSATDPAPAPGRATAGLRYVTVPVAGVDDVHEAVATCVAAGADTVIAPMTAGPIRFAIVADPEGNWMEFGASARTD